MNDARRVFADICRGYSTLKRDRKSLYVKHLSHIDQVDLDDCDERAKEDARRKKLEPEIEKLKWLAKRGLWSEQDEKGLESTKKQIANMAQTRAKLFLPSDKERMSILMNDMQAKMGKAAALRRHLLGLTQERYAEERSLMYHIKISLYKDASLESPFYSDKSIEEIDDDELNDLLYSYNDLMEPFGERGLRQVAVSDTFLAYFLHAPEGPFFRRPTSELSFYQLNLLYWARHFKSIIQNTPNLPKEALGDPDKIEDFLTGAAKTKEIISKGPKRATGEAVKSFAGIVTQDPGDLQKLGVKHGQTITV